MNLRTSLISQAVALALVSPLVAAARQSEAVGEAYEKASRALSMVYCAIKEDDTAREVVGIGICIDQSGVIMTPAIDTRTDPEAIQDCTLVLPGDNRIILKAKFLGMDTLSGLAFLQAEGSHHWSPIPFESKTKFTLGEDVISVGILEAAGAHTLYIGRAQVSSMLRMPETLVYVTGGRLTSPGSVVFSREGKAIGIVAKQVPLNSRVIVDGAASLYAIQGIHETSFFTPAEEISHVLINIPRQGKVRRPSWIGANKFDFVSTGSVGTGTSAIRIEQVLPTSAGHKSGLRDKDLILAVDGQDVEVLSTPHLTTQAFVRRLFKLQPGYNVRLAILRDGAKIMISVPVEEMPEDLSQPQPLQFLDRTLGLLLGERSEDSPQASAATSPASEGVRVLAVTRDGPAMKAGIRSGDLIRKVNGTSVESISSYKELHEKRRQAPPRPIQITVLGKDQQETLVIIPHAE